MESSGTRHRTSKTATIADATEYVESTTPPGAAASSQAEGRDMSYRPAIASKDEIPQWLRDNDYIMNGHPMPTASYKRSYRLWMCLHMEFMNIWTHALGSVGFVIAGFSLLGLVSESVWRDLRRGDQCAFGIYFTSCAIAFGLSANFHTLRSHSYHIHHLWGRIDILGICLLAFGGGFSATYYAFYANSTPRYIYWSINAAAAVAAAVTLFDTGGGGSKMRTL